MDRSLKVAVVIASTGRPVEIEQLLEHLNHQTYPADKIVLSVVGPADAPAQPPPAVVVVSGSKGLPSQRNRGLESVIDDADIIIFFDDDYLPSDRALEGIVRLFSVHQDIVGANGRLLADGIHSAGITYEAAMAMIDRYDATTTTGINTDGLVEVEGLYGCNMAFRTAAIGDTRFDESLPLYGWQEDIDFSAQLLPKGRIVQSLAFVGVHRGVKGARTSGKRLGYSQVINPIYLSRKGTMRSSYAFKIVRNNVLANHLRVWIPEPWIDRKGRLLGNWLALLDILIGRAHPMRILDIA